MEIRTLRYFLAVAREENMTRAAEMLHVTQPTLSKALKSLEEELDKKLFIRQSFSICLTDEGMLLRERAEDLVSMADKIEKEFVSLDDIAGGELFLGLAESCLIKYIADAIKALKERYPYPYSELSRSAFCCFRARQISLNPVRQNLPTLTLQGIRSFRYHTSAH